MGLADALSKLIDSIADTIASMLKSFIDAMDTLDSALESWVLRHFTEWASWRETEIPLTYGGRIQIRYIDPDDYEITANKIPGVSLNG